MSEELFVLYSAPTLAGIKTGNLFSVDLENGQGSREGIRRLNRLLTVHGIRVIPLKEMDHKLLIYVYRPSKLQNDLRNEQLVEILRRFDYPVSDPDRCIVRLTERLRESSTFPHEIGLFLSYPPVDVQGFMDNQAHNFKSIGTWKVYGDEEEAKKTFRKYEKCTSDYCARIGRGDSLEKLVV